MKRLLVISFILIISGCSTGLVERDYNPNTNFSGALSIDPDKTRCTDQACTYELVMKNNSKTNCTGCRYITPKLKMVESDCSGRIVKEQFMDYDRINPGSEQLKKATFGLEGSVVIQVRTRDIGWKTLGEINLPGNC